MYEEIDDRVSPELYGTDGLVGDHTEEDPATDTPLLFTNALYRAYTRRRQSTNASRLRIQASSSTPTKWYELEPDNLPFRPLTMSPSLMMAKDYRYSRKPFKLQKQKVQGSSGKLAPI